MTPSSPISSDKGYEKLVDRLLESPRYGEHMARFWLDAARYGDTHGLHLDNYREIWPYRDWVIKAFNANKPFDQFVIEQLAGDLLPNPTLDQLVATGYNRCHVSTSEGGSIEEEVYVRNVVDQIDTNGTVFLGMTIGCARCHDHKYDPLRMKDYYQLFAFFNNIDGPALDGNIAQWAPIAKVPTAELKTAPRSGRQEGRRSSPGDRRPRRRRPLRPTTARLMPSRARYVRSGPISSGLTMRSPIGRLAQGDAAWEFVTRPDHPVYSGKASLANHRPGAQATVLRQRRAEAQGRRRRLPCLPRSISIR